MVGANSCKGGGTTRFLDAQMLLSCLCHFLKFVVFVAGTIVYMPGDWWTAAFLMLLLKLQQGHSVELLVP
jgi:hypothetical protein